jgi:hypothetical protein
MWCFWMCGAVFLFRIVHLPDWLSLQLDACKHFGCDVRTMVLSETRHIAGLTLLRVQRGGLGYGVNLS